MTHMFRVAALLAFGLLPLAMALPADANWSIRSLTNKTNQTISISIPFGPNETRQQSGYMVRGNIAVVIPGQGPVLFLDKGHNTNCGRPYWGVAVSYQNQTWGIFYDGDGTVDMTVNADGSIAFAPGPATQVVNGSGGPQCH